MGQEPPGTETPARPMWGKVPGSFPKETAIKRSKRSVNVVVLIVKHPIAGVHALPGRNEFPGCFAAAQESLLPRVHAAFFRMIGNFPKRALPGRTHHPYLHLLTNGVRLTCAQDRSGRLGPHCPRDFFRPFSLVFSAGPPRVTERTYRPTRKPCPSTKNTRYILGKNLNKRTYFEFKYRLKRSNNR